MIKKGGEEKKSYCLTIKENKGIIMWAFKHFNQLLNIGCILYG